MDNLQLYGLDPTDPSGSLCTCMRELVENALDAVGTNSAHTDLALIQRESTHVVEAAQHRSLSISLEPQDTEGDRKEEFIILKMQWIILRGKQCDD